MKARMSHRVLTTLLKNSTRQAYRSGWYTMWDYAGAELKQWGIPQPGTFYPDDNVMGGVMFSTSAEYRKHPLSEDRCARVLELMFERGCLVSELKLVRKTCSFIHLLDTGIASKNYPLVDGMYRSFDIKACAPPTKQLKPMRIPVVKQLIDAWTREWRAGGGMPLLKFLVSCLMAYDGFIIGSRPNSDMDKIRDSREHSFFIAAGCWCTKYTGGRSKLPMHKAGTRDWYAWRQCLCPRAQHVSPAEDFEYTFDKDGNSYADLSRYCTTCPLFIGEVLKRVQSGGLGCYRQWLPNQHRFGKSNYGNRNKMIVEFFRFQGVLGAEELFDSNAGRKALARWLSAVSCPYPESFQIMGDNEDVWRKNYQPDLPPSGGFTDRDQSTDSFVATAALRRFRKLVGRDAPMPQLPNLSKDQQVLMMMAEQMGLGRAAANIYASR